jgi:hypothetical protein
MAPFPQFPENPDDFSVVWREVLSKMQASTSPYAVNWEVPSDMVGSFMDNFG